MKLRPQVDITSSCLSSSSLFEQILLLLDTVDTLHSSRGCAGEAPEGGEAR